MKNRNMPFICLFAATNDGGNGNDGEAKKSKELEAIETVSKNLESYKEKLGEKADKEQIEQMESTISELKEGIENMTGKQVTDKMEEINKGMKSAFDQIAELQDELAQRKDGGDNGDKREKGELISKKAAQEFIDKAFDEDGAKKSGEANLTLKAAETFGAGVTFVSGSQPDAFTGRTIDPELYEDRRKPNLILDNFPMKPIDTPKLIYLVKVDEGDNEAPNGESGGADWIDCGASKPKRSFRLDTEEVEAKKVAIFSTVDDCLLQDVASMRNWINEDLIDEMREAINDGLLNNDQTDGAASLKAPIGLKQNAVQYSATPGYDEELDDPNYIDDIIAGIAFLRYNRENADMVFVSSDVYYAIHHLKGSDGHWMNNNLVYVNNMGQLFIAGVLVKPADEEDVPSTHVLIVDMTAFKIRPYGDMALERGLNGDNFREDKTSFRGYQRFLSYIPENREKGVLYDTFANIAAAITKPAT